MAVRKRFWSSSMATSKHFVERSWWWPGRNTDSSPSSCKESRTTTSAETSANSCLNSGGGASQAITWKSLRLFRMRVIDSLSMRLQQRMSTLVGLSTAGPHRFALVFAIGRRSGPNWGGTKLAERRCNYIWRQNYNFHYTSRRAWYARRNSWPGRLPIRSNCKGPLGLPCAVTPEGRGCPRLTHGRLGLR
jgi:hypothetical protein